MIDNHDLAQWLALAGAVAGIWFRLRQRDDRVAAEARRQTKVEADIRGLQQKMDAHIAGECKIVQKLDNLLEEIHDVRERMVRLETWIESERRKP